MGPGRYRGPAGRCECSPGCGAVGASRRASCGSTGRAACDAHCRPRRRNGSVVFGLGGSGYLPHRRRTRRTHVGLVARRKRDGDTWPGSAHGPSERAQPCFGAGRRQPKVARSMLSLQRRLAYDAPVARETAPAAVASGHPARPSEWPGGVRTARAGDTAAGVARPSCEADCWVSGTELLDLP